MKTKNSIKYGFSDAINLILIGKEMTVYSYRLRKSLENIKSIKACEKFNGATGNYAAISVAFPNENWPVLAKCFIEDYLELEFNSVTTQIESHDYICHILDGIRHFNNVLFESSNIT